MDNLLIKNCAKLTFFNDGYNAINLLQNTDILIKGNVVARIDKGIAEDGCQVIDGGGKLVLPGLGNGHSRCLANKVSRIFAEDWHYERLGKTPLYARVNPIVNTALETLSDSQLESILELAVYEAANSGTTTLLEHCSVRELPIFLGLCEKYGLRTLAAPMLMNQKALPVSDGWDRHTDTVEDVDEDALVAWNADFVTRTRGRLQRAMLGIGSAETTRPSLMRKVADAARELDCHVMAILNETRHEREVCMARYGVSPATLLSENGIITRKALLCGNLLSDHKERLLIKAGDASAVVHPLQAMMDAEITPFIQILIDDILTICGSGRGSVDMFRHLAALALNGKLESRNPSQMCAHDAFFAATTGVGRVLGENLGQIEEGFAADLLIADLQKPEFTPLTVPPGEVVYALTAADVSHVIVDGKLVKENGAVVGADPRGLVAKSRDAYETLWQNVRERGIL